MESRLAVLAASAALIALPAARVASVDSNKKALARQLFELGIEEYKQKQYEAAVQSMQKSYALDPQPEALYALAQSERLNGNCNDAITHYEKLLDTAKDDQTTTAVKANLELCYESARGDKPKPEAQPDAKTLERQNAPTIQIRTVYRTEQKSNRLAIALYAVGGVALGGAVTTYVLASSTRSDADHATSLADYNTLFDRSQRLRYTSYAAAIGGVALVTWATIRVVRGGSAKSSDVAVVPTRGGSFVAWTGSW